MCMCLCGVNVYQVTQLNPKIRVQHSDAQQGELFEESNNFQSMSLRNSNDRKQNILRKYKKIGKPNKNRKIH